MRGWLPKRRVSSPSPLLFKCQERPWLRVHSHFSPRFEPLLSEPSPVMSSLNGSTIGGDKIPKGSEKEARALEMTPPASRKRGRPKGSHNKNTLEALTAAAAVAPSTSPQSGRLGLLVMWASRKNGGLAVQRGAGGKPRPQRRPLLRRTRTRRPLLPSGPLPPTLRGPAQRPHLQMVRRGFGWRNRHSSRRPTSWPRGGPPA
jgi:hypothetical protein